MMSVATHAIWPMAHGQADPSDMVSVGTIVWLSSELMFFAALFAAYFTIRSISPDLWAIETDEAQHPVRRCQHHVLVLSSVTCQFGVFAAERGKAGRTGKLSQFKLWGMREWFVLTYLMGAFFIAGQAYEYAALVTRARHDPVLALRLVFYLATGFHGLHVTGGLIAFLFVLGRTFVARTFTHEQAITAIVVSYYWHFVDVVWIGLFATIYLLK